MDIKEYIKNIVREIISEEELDEMSLSGDAGAYSTPFAFKGNKKGKNIATKTAVSQGMKLAPVGMPKDSKILDYKQISGKKPKTYKMYESIENIVKKELLNEVTYNKFKNEVKLRSKNEMLHKSLKEVKYKLNEVDRLIEYTLRLKQELSEGEEGLNYWKRSLKSIDEINIISENISNKIKNIHQ